MSKVLSDTPGNQTHNLLAVRQLITASQHGQVFRFSTQTDYLYWPRVFTLIWQKKMCPWTSTAGLTANTVSVLARRVAAFIWALSFRRECKLVNPATGHTKGSNFHHPEILTHMQTVNKGQVLTNREDKTTECCIKTEPSLKIINKTW